MRPGEIWLVDLGEPVGRESGFRRPALVVGDPRVQGPLAFVCPLTTTKRAYPWRVELEASAINGLSETSYVQCEHMRSIASARGIVRLGFAGLPTWHRVRLVLRRLLDL